MEGRDPAAFAADTDAILDDAAPLAELLGARPPRRARDYTWSTAAGPPAPLYADLTARALVDCA